MSLDAVDRPVHVYFPAEGAEYVERLLGCTPFRRAVEVVCHPVPGDGTVDEVAGATLSARRLDHGMPTLGWRLDEPGGRRMLPDRLAALGVRGAAVGRLSREGSLDVDGRLVSLDEVSAPRPGQSFAFVMDTRECAGAEALVERTDLAVCEATFLHRDADLADAYGHLTAARAARLAAAGGARRLVLTHFSQRYPDPADYAGEAEPLFPGVHVAADLDRVPVPPRR